MHTFARLSQGDGTYLYIVGCWGPANDGTMTWNPMRDCKSASEAARWVSYLNGGERPAADWDAP